MTDLAVTSNPDLVLRVCIGYVRCKLCRERALVSVARKGPVGVLCGCTRFYTTSKGEADREVASRFDRK